MKPISQVAAESGLNNHIYNIIQWEI